MPRPRIAIISRPYWHRRINYSIVAVIAVCYITVRGQPLCRVKCPKDFDGARPAVVTFDSRRRYFPWRTPTQMVDPVIVAVFFLSNYNYILLLSWIKIWTWTGIEIGFKYRWNSLKNHWSPVQTSTGTNRIKKKKQQILKQWTHWK